MKKTGWYHVGPRKANFGAISPNTLFTLNYKTNKWTVEEKKENPLHTYQYADQPEKSTQRWQKMTCTAWLPKTAYNESIFYQLMASAS